MNCSECGQDVTMQRNPHNNRTLQVACACTVLPVKVKELVPDAWD